MNYEFFEPHFVHFIWNEELEGKKVFLADNIADLIDVVEEGYSGACTNVQNGENDNVGMPFRLTWSDGSTGSCYQFAYYDPHYELKVAYSKGKQIQSLENGEWKDCAVPTWSVLYEYRVKPDEPEDHAVSNIMLAKWLAAGRGQVRRISTGQVRTYWTYHEDEDFCTVPVDGSVGVRKWDGEWIVPTVEYLCDQSQ